MRERERAREREKRERERERERERDREGGGGVREREFVSVSPRTRINTYAYTPILKSPHTQARICEHTLQLMCGMTRSYVARDSSVCVTRLVLRDQNV